MVQTQGDMYLFYTTQINNKLALLQGEEAHHCAQVLRKKTGDDLTFTDGKGKFYEGSIIETSKHSCTLRINKEWAAEHKRPFHLQIAIAPTKNIDRLEWFVEKATEIGIDSITPILCERSERKIVRTDRLEKIAIAAMKQSLKASVPGIQELMPIEKFILQASGSQKFIAYVDEHHTAHLKDICQKTQNVVVLIGPEGDFTAKEIQFAQENGYQPVSLGKSRLRTETAGLAACHIVNLINE